MAVWTVRSSRCHQACCSREVWAVAAGGVVGAAVAAVGPLCSTSPRQPTVPPLLSHGRPGPVLRPKASVPASTSLPVTISGVHKHPAKGTAGTRGASPESVGLICTGLAGAASAVGKTQRGRQSLESHPTCGCGPKHLCTFRDPGRPPPLSPQAWRCLLPLPDLSLLPVPAPISEKGWSRAWALSQPSQVCAHSWQC